jgi:DNA-nicking Smr family endonuclease
MSNKKSTDNNDMDLFSEAMQDVIPLQVDRVEHKVKPVNTKRTISTATLSSTTQQHKFSTENVPECDVLLRFERPGLQKAYFKKLRSGKMPPEASLDLHGYTAEQARSALIQFLEYCSQQQLKVVCIVHGKGFGSSDKKAVIKPLVNKWLQEADEVLAFTSAQPRDGGTGAVYVLLKKSENSAT